MTEGFATKISALTICDLDAVDELMKRHSGTLGFLPRVALEDYLLKSGVLGAKTGDGRLVGYLMYAANRDRFRIAQLCVSETHRSRGIARLLLEALKESASTQKIITLRCRNDYSAHGMWPELGFVPIGESPGRSKEGYLLTLWRLQLARYDQLDLFRANMSDDVLDVVFDAQIFFDFDRPESEVTQPSKALISDHFVDSVNLWFTDELLIEIGRNPNASDREEARRRTDQFFPVRHHPLLVDGFEEKLKQVLPSRNQNQLSDIRHLAKTAASEIGTFVTRDGLLLNKAAQIEEAVHVQVLSPTRMVLKLRELSETEPPAPENVSGPGLSWRRLTSDDLSAFPSDRFLRQGERLGELESKVNSLLSNPTEADVEVLWSGDDPIALRGLRYGSPSSLAVSVCRAAGSVRSTSIRRFPIADAIGRAITQGIEMVKVEDSVVTPDLLPALSIMGFTRCAGGYVRFCFTRHMERDKALSEIVGLAPDGVGYEDLSELDLERACSPLVTGATHGYYLIPIRPEYARDLFDRQLSASDMFGGDPDVLLRWSNVYYRAATHYNVLTAPGRILWYVSGNSREIAAVSHLDEVVLDGPKELFKKFRKYGTFEWEQLFKLCSGDVSKPVMALLFSHTFPLRRRVPLNEIRKVFAEDGVSQTPQSPRKIPAGTFRKLFDLGYPEQT